MVLSWVQSFSHTEREQHRPSLNSRSGGETGSHYPDKFQTMRWANLPKGQGKLDEKGEM